MAATTLLGLRRVAKNLRRLEPLRLAVLCMPGALLAAQLACTSQQAAQASLVVRGAGPQTLASADLIAVEGTYAGCTRRAGAWSIAVGVHAQELDPPHLTVLRGDTACVLTLTGLRTSGALFMVAPEIVLSTSYADDPVAFGDPISFYANARLSDVDFAGDFQLTLLHSSDPSLVRVSHTATAIPPEVIARTPAPGATGRSVNTRPTATFDAPMNAASLTNATFTLRGDTLIAGTVTYDVASRTVTLDPYPLLEVNRTYTATITIGASDIGGTPLASNHVWSFTTALSSQGAVALGAASRYAVLADAAVSNTGATMITGDVGASAPLIGFPPGIISGTVHIADAADAISDLTNAYDDAAGRMLDPVVVDGNIGGSTRLPGLYRAPTTLAVSAGDLILDANDEPDAVFIFQVGTSFTMTADRKILLVRGARGANIFWQVGSSATLGTGSVLHGTIMADQSITLTTNAEVQGRALARGATITMDTNTIVRPDL